MVQTDLHSWATGTGDGRQVAGGSAPGTLPLVILEVIVFCLPASQHPLQVWDNNKGVNKKNKKKQIHAEHCECVDFDEDVTLCLICNCKETCTQFK